MKLCNHLGFLLLCSPRVSAADSWRVIALADNTHRNRRQALKNPKVPFAEARRHEVRFQNELDLQNAENMHAPLLVILHIYTLPQLHNLYILSLCAHTPQKETPARMPPARVSGMSFDSATTSQEPGPWSSSSFFASSGLFFGGGFKGTFLGWFL